MYNDRLNIPLSGHNAKYAAIKLAFLHHNFPIKNLNACVYICATTVLHTQLRPGLRKQPLL